MPTNFTYTQNIPLATNKPSVDQPNMKINTNSINSIVAVDHLSFGQATGTLSDGYHKVIHFSNQPADPAAIVGTGQLYTKTILGDQQLFYRSGGGVITQLTNATGLPPNAPTILTGTFALGAAFANITALPANVYGYIIFYHQGPSIVQISSFATTATNCLGGSTRVVDNGTSNDDPVELNNNNAALFLQGRRDDFAGANYPWVLHYWSF